MEIRGLGIINIREIFGPRSIRPRSPIDLIIRLKKWRRGAGARPAGPQAPRRRRSSWGTRCPSSSSPSRPGRNIATLIEVACKVHLLRKRGYHAPSEIMREAGPGPVLRRCHERAAKDNRFLIVTGLSGSGKTVVSRFLEDLGYYCVDNLPAKLIPSFVDLWQKKKVEIDRVALIVDIREPALPHRLPRRSSGRSGRRSRPRLIFLEASDETLVKRFSESRRPHPLARRRPVLEGVRLERQRMAADHEDGRRGHRHVRPQHLPAQGEPRRRVLQAPEAADSRSSLVSFGYKYGLPLDSDLVFDTRFLPNPFYVDRLRTGTARRRSVRDYVLGLAGDEGVPPAALRASSIPSCPASSARARAPLAIAVGCTGGKHRSVVVAEELRAHLKAGAAESKFITGIFINRRLFL